MYEQQNLQNEGWGDSFNVDNWWDEIKSLPEYKDYDQKWSNWYDKGGRDIHRMQIKIGNAHEAIDAEIQQNSLMNFLIKALTQFTPLRGGPQQVSELYKAMDEGFSYPDYVPDLMRKRHREGAYGTMGQDFDAFQRGIADELGYRKY